jgi:hypothetical protein
MMTGADKTEILAPSARYVQSPTALRVIYSPIASPVALRVILTPFSSPSGRVGASEARSGVREGSAW